MPENVRDLGKLIVAKGSKKVAQSLINCPIWSHRMVYTLLSPARRGSVTRLGDFWNPLGNTFSYNSLQNKRWPICLVCLEKCHILSKTCLGDFCPTFETFGLLFVQLLKHLDYFLGNFWDIWATFCSNICPRCLSASFVMLKTRFDAIRCYLTSTYNCGMFFAHPWSSLVLGDEGWIGPSRKRLC